jgi:hypothetical protein
VCPLAVRDRYDESPVRRQGVTDGDPRNAPFAGRRLGRVPGVDDEATALEDGAPDARTDTATELADAGAGRLDAVGARDGFENRRRVLRSAPETDVARERRTDVEASSGNAEDVDGFSGERLEPVAGIGLDAVRRLSLDDSARTVDADPQTAVQPTRVAGQVEEAEVQASGRLYPDSHRRTLTTDAL